MSDPFRDHMNAAMLRVDQLAEENAGLRDELEKLRRTAGEVKARKPDDALADQTLRVLEQLDVASQRRPQVRVDVGDAADTDAAPAEQRAPRRASLPLHEQVGAPYDVLKLPADTGDGWRTRAVFFACAASAAVGALLEWLLTHP